VPRQPDDNKLPTSITGAVDRWRKDFNAKKQAAEDRLTAWAISGLCAGGSPPTQFQAAMVGYVDPPPDVAALLGRPPDDGNAATPPIQHFDPEIPSSAEEALPPELRSPGLQGDLY